MGKSYKKNKLTIDKVYIPRYYICEEYIYHGYIMRDHNQPSDPFLPLTPAVFQILLALLDGEQHGYRIMQLVETNSRGKFKMGPGTLYGTIKRMLADGLIEETGDRPDTSMVDQRRRYYRLTPMGIKAARAEAERLAVLVSSARAKNLLPPTGNEIV